jgi:hypothetical protein
MAAPAGAVATPPIGAGIASGIVHGTLPPTIACTPPGGYVFQGVGIAGVFSGSGGQAAGTVSVTNPSPAGAATGDPLDGTPLGCTGTGATLFHTISSAVPVGTPLVGCPDTSGCNGGAGTSNILADEGNVNSAAVPFGCIEPGLTPVNVGITAANGVGNGNMNCRLHGTFVRYGATVLVFLTGTTGANGANGAVGSDLSDVVVAAQVQTTVATPDSVFAGPFILTPRGATSVDQAALDLLYCPMVAAGLAAHTAGQYPPVADCR